MSRPAPQFEVIGNVPDSAFDALARLLLDVADRELAAEDDANLETAERPRDDERTDEAVATPRRL